MKVLVCISFLFIFAFVVFPCTVTISKIKADGLYGRVIDINKALIPGAIIQIYQNTKDGEKGFAVIRADKDGRFELKDFPAGNYMIKANAEGFAYSYASMKLKKSSGKVKKREIVFTLVPYDGCSGLVEIQRTK
jgi:hypothetical protein